jgi:hypothetical protein
MNDSQAIIRSQVDHYLDTHLIEDLRIHHHLIEVTAADEDKSYLPTGRVTVTIDLANQAGPSVEQIDNEPCAHGVMAGECFFCEPLRSPTFPGGLAGDTGPESNV